MWVGTRRRGTRMRLVGGRRGKGFWRREPLIWILEERQQPQDDERLIRQAQRIGRLRRPGNPVAAGQQIGADAGSWVMVRIPQATVPDWEPLVQNGEAGHRHLTENSKSWMTMTMTRSKNVERSKLASARRTRETWWPCEHFGVSSESFIGLAQRSIAWGLCGWAGWVGWGSKRRWRHSKNIPEPKRRRRLWTATPPAPWGSFKPTVEAL